jgi:pimeloyl-ACP methyl ester carboxylesterase
MRRKFQSRKKLRMNIMPQKYSFVPVLAALVFLIVCAAAVFAQTESTPPPFPPPGKLIDIGGWRLHLNCVGQARPSQPTIILESGIGDFSVEWALVQPGVARFARVCSYDRAGDGWSDLGPHPRTMRQIVYELHTLLNKGGVKPPFILVGHSYGGVLVRLYASTYPADVLGMVLVEAGDDNPRRILPDGKLGRSSDMVKGEPIPAVKVSGPLRLSDIPPVALRQMKAAAQQAAQTANEPPRNKLPLDAQHMRSWALARVEHIAAAVNPFEHEELAVLRADRAKTQYPLGDMPLIVLTRGLSEDEGPDGKAFAEEHRKDHEAIAAMSRKGKLVVAANSGHHVQIDEPELVIKAVLDVMNGLMKSSGGQARIPH